MITACLSVPGQPLQLIDSTSSSCLHQRRSPAVVYTMNSRWRSPLTPTQSAFYDTVQMVAAQCMCFLYHQWFCAGASHWRALYGAAVIEFSNTHHRTSRRAGCCRMSSSRHQARVAWPSSTPIRLTCRQLIHLLQIICQMLCLKALASDVSPADSAQHARDMQQQLQH